MNTYLTSEERAKIEAATVGICGCGGLGSNCAMHLVRAGVKKLVLVDFDVVSESNLNRQFFFRDQIGLLKVEALAANLRRIEPNIELTLVNERLDASGVEKLFSSCDVVVEAVDVAETKAMIIARMMQLKKPLVTASGMAGWGRSAAMTVRRLSSELVVVGDGARAVSEAEPPQSPRVGIAAAMEANSVIALLLGAEV